MSRIQRRSGLILDAPPPLEAHRHGAADRRLQAAGELAEVALGPRGDELQELAHERQRDRLADDLSGSLQRRAQGLRQQVRVEEAHVLAEPLEAQRARQHLGHLERGVGDRDVDLGGFAGRQLGGARRHRAHALEDAAQHRLGDRHQASFGFVERRLRVRDGAGLVSFGFIRLGVRRSASPM